MTVVTYGVLLPQLGFYRDDWYLLATAQSEGPAGIISLFQIDRPLLGYLYAGAYRLLGVDPLAWQVATLVLRVAGNLLFWRLLRMTWPARKAEALGIALLFSVYPGYSVQPNAGVYSTDLAAHAAALLSIALALSAMRTSRPLARIALSVAAGVLELLYLGIFESAIGMEVARLAFVWYVSWKEQAESIKRTTLRALKADVLYLLLAGAFLFWRLAIFQSTRRATNLDVLLGRYGTLPVRSALSIAVETLKDIYETTILAWTVPFYQFVSSAAYRDLAVATVVAAMVIALIVLLAQRTPTAEVRGDAERPGSAYRDDGSWCRHRCVCAASHRPGRPKCSVCRSMGSIHLVCLLRRGADCGCSRISLPARTGAHSGSAGISGDVGVVHFFSAASYRDFWSWQRDLWQQMVWRAPGIRSGTMLFVSLPAGGYQEGYEIYGPANMIYYPGRPCRSAAM